MLQAAAEEQLSGLGAYPQRSRCIKGCNADETAYHIACSCPVRATTPRHDFIVHWVLKTILRCTRAPEDTQKNFQFGKATMKCSYVHEGRTISVETGNKILTGKKLYHNRPDIVVKLTNPTIIYILEIAVSHIQNLREQERLKRVRYAVNSTVHVDSKNVQSVQRDLNLLSELELMYKCPVQMGILVLGCFGEVVYTEEQGKFDAVLAKLGVNQRELQILKNKCSYSIAVSTTNMLLRRMDERRTK